MALVPRGALSHLDRCPGDVRVIDAPHVHRGPPRRRVRCPQRMAMTVSAGSAASSSCPTMRSARMARNCSACSLMLMKPGMERRTASPEGHRLGAAGLDHGHRQTARAGAMGIKNREVPFEVTAHADDIDHIDHRDSGLDLGVLRHRRSARTAPPDPARAEGPPSQTPRGTEPLPDGRPHLRGRCWGRCLRSTPA